jgi:hypothetical protein
MIVKKTSYLMCFITALLGLQGCGGGCTANREPALRISVVDKSTGLPLCQVKYHVSNQFTSQGCVADSTFADEMPGNYTIKLKKEGYKDWIKENVTVTAGGCHVSTVEVKAEMESL